MKIDLDDDEFHLSSSLINHDVQEITSPNTSSHDESTTTTSTSSELSIIQHPDDTNESFNRICSALQNLINDAQVALQKPNSSSSSNQLLGLPQKTTRPRAQSWSSNVGSWIMNHYNPSPVVCECGSCWLCLESNGSSLSSTTTTAKTTPKSSRANSISSTRNFSLLKSQQEESNKRQVQLARIKKHYRKKLEGRSDYRKSCEDLEMELQKLITTAISTGVEHGLMNSPTYHHYQFHDEHDGDSSPTQRYKLNHYDYFRNHDYDEVMSDQSFDENGDEKFSRFPMSFSKAFEIFGKHEQFKKLEKEILNDINSGGNNEKKSSKWRRRIWNCLQKIGVNLNNNNNDDDNNNANHNENVEKDEEDNENNWYNSYSSYNSSWSSSSRDDRENSREDDDDPSNPFPSSFINTLNIGQNIFNFNVNLIYSKTNNYNKKTTNNYFNDIDNSSHITNNYYNYNTTINNNEEQSPQLKFTKESKKSQSLALKCVNLLVMMGFMFSMSQAMVSYSTSPAIMTRNLTRNLIRSRARGRRSGSNLIMTIKVIKYITVLFVGWAAGRIGKKQKESPNENNRITDLK